MKRSKCMWLLAALLAVPVTQFGQKTDFSGIRIFVNPGHGGYDSDDRHMIATDFWESEGNLVKGLFLRQLLEDRNATVYISRTANNTTDDLALSVIATMANTANADFFLSIHSNGFDGTRNQPLMLFRGYDNSPVFPTAKTFAHTLWEKIFEKGNCWTHSSEWVKGDWTFYPEWGNQVGLGVLRTLNMPGVLSEGSYHDYIPEGWRLRNENHLHHEAWAMLRALQHHFGVTTEPSGIVAGTVRDELTSPSWYYGPSTRDRHMPINDATVTLMPLGRTVKLDNLNNGFFMFDSVPPGTYQVIASGMTDFYNDTLTAAVVAGQTTLADLLPSFDTVRVPVVTDFQPLTADSVRFNQAFTLTFSIPMDMAATQAALVFDPEVNLTYEWDEKGKVLTVKPQIGYASRTTYHVRLTTAAASRWNVHLAGEFLADFVTKSRPRLVIEKIWPSDGAAGITLYPRLTVRFDAPLDEASASAGIRLVDSQSAPVAKQREIFTSGEGLGSYSFEPAAPLQLSSSYRLEIDPSVKDIAGVSVGTAANALFATRTTAYPSGSMIESFDNIGAFWDPEASGSTMGTDNPLTTFTASQTVYKSNPPAGRLDYLFTDDEGGVCRVYNTAKPTIGSGTTRKFAMWVYGDLSNNNLEYWFYSSGSENQIVPASTINWAGWDLISIPFSSIGGSGELQYHSMVVRQSSAGEKGGTMYFDDVMVIIPTGTEYPADDLTGLVIYPNPVRAEGWVSFMLQSDSHVDISLYAVDGSFAASLFTGTLGAGKHSIPCNPSQLVATGIYTLRLGILGGGDDAWQFSCRRWVVLE